MCEKGRKEGGEALTGGMIEVRSICVVGDDGDDGGEEGTAICLLGHCVSDQTRNTMVSCRAY